MKEMAMHFCGDVGVCAIIVHQHKLSYTAGIYTTGLASYSYLLMIIIVQNEAWIIIFLIWVMGCRTFNLKANRDPSALIT